jgi:hypothetical protein
MKTLIQVLHRSLSNFDTTFSSITVVFSYNFHLDITPVKGENLLFVKTEV